GRASGVRTGRGGGFAAGRGPGGVATTARRVRAGHRLPPAPGNAHRRAARLAAGRGLRRWRNLSGFRCAGACAADAEGILPRRRRLGHHHARWRAGVRRRQQPGEARDRRLRSDGGRDREGQLPPLHAEGDLRAADRRRPDVAQLPAPRGPDRRAAADRFRPVEDQPRDHRRSRHQLLRWHGGEISVRTLCAPARGHRCRFGIPLSRSGAGAGRPGAVHFAIWRDGRYAGCAAPSQGGRADHRRGGQRADEFDGARGGPAAADPRRSGDRRR
ncbi:hypothetical protein OY671_008512, partial [Metschnikowia pulcherrima]